MAWRYGGMDPYRTYHGLDGSYRPLGRSDEPPRPPASLRRQKAFIYACALFAHGQDTDRTRAMIGGKR